MSREIISTPNAPAAIGTYSQAVQVGNTVYLSGQIPLDPATDAAGRAATSTPRSRRVFENLKAVATAAGGSLNDAVKITVFLTDLAHFARVNEIMATYFKQPYPGARRGGRGGTAARRARGDGVHPRAL